MPKKAIIYARVSTRGQADKDISLPSQIEGGHKKAAELGADVVKVFVDSGISGRSDARNDFQEAIDYCAVFGIDYFITWNTARFARNRLDAGLYKRELRKGGTQMVYVSQNIDGESDEGWMLEGLFELMDEQQSRTISKDTRRSMIKNAQDAFFNGGTIPFGYRAVAVGDRKRLQINEAEAPTVREAFYSLLSGLGTKAIARALNDAGKRRRGGRAWSKDTLTYMLKNPVYTGQIVFNRKSNAKKFQRDRSEWIETKSHEAIMPSEEFERVQALFADRAPARLQGSPKSSYIFTGILRCGACDQGLQIETATGRSRVYSYYNCRAALKGSGCRNRRIPARELDEWLLASIVDKIFTREKIETIAHQLYELKGQWVKDRATRRADIVRRLRDAETRRRKLFEILELHGKDAPNLGDLKPRLTTLNEAIRAAEVELTQLEAQPAPAAPIGPIEIDGLAQSIRDVVMESDNPGKVREFISQVVDHAIVTDTEVIIYYRPGKIFAGGVVVQSSKRWLPDISLLRTEKLRVLLPGQFIRKAA